MKKLRLLRITIILLVPTTIVGSVIITKLIKDKLDQSQARLVKFSEDFELENLYDAVLEEDPKQETSGNGSVPEKSRDIYIAAWIPYWDLTSSVESYKNNIEYIDSLSPTWYYVKPDGSLGLKNTAHSQASSDLIALCTENDTDIIPSISNSNADTLSLVLNNEAILNNHIHAIVNEVNTYDYDGIDIDYEHINSSDKEAFSNFIRLLSEKLHTNGKVLTIAILWKNELESLINTVSESRAAQDWKEIGKYVDEFRIMAYDYTHSYETEGPIAPKEWIKSIILFANENVPKDKIVLGLPLYAYEWNKDSSDAKALVYSDVESIKQNSNNLIVRDELNEEYWEKQLIYQVSGIEKVVWYQDSEVTEKRAELAQEYGINKFVFWRLGGEGQGLYKIKK